MVPASTSSSDNDRTRSELRTELIETSGELLRSNGVGDFSTTKVADACDTSTQMIYTLFGGKSGLLKAVYETKAKELSQKFDAVDKEDSIDQFFEMGEVYRDFMLEHAALYDTVFSLEALQNYDRRDSLIERVEPFERFDEVIVDLIEAELLPEDTDVSKLTDELWASMNGIIQLTLLDFYSDEETARDHYFDTASKILAGQSGGDIPI